MLTSIKGFRCFSDCIVPHPTQPRCLPPPALNYRLTLSFCNALWSVRGARDQGKVRGSEHSSPALTLCHSLAGSSRISLIRSGIAQCASCFFSGPASSRRVYLLYHSRFLYSDLLLGPESRKVAMRLRSVALCMLLLMASVQPQITEEHEVLD